MNEEAGSPVRVSEVPTQGVSRVTESRIQDGVLLGVSAGVADASRRAVALMSGLGRTTISLTPGGRLR